MASVPPFFLVRCHADLMLFFKVRFSVKMIFGPFFVTRLPSFFLPSFVRAWAMFLCCCRIVLVEPKLMELIVDGVLLKNDVPG